MNSNSTHSLERKINTISNISADDLALLLSIVRVQQVAKNDFLLQEGQVCKHICFVENGFLRTFYNKDGKHVNLAFTPEDNFVTDLKSLKTGTPSAYNIQADEPTTVYLFEKQELLQLYTQSPGITAFGRVLLEQLLMEQEAHTNIFRLHSPAERYQYLVTHHPILLQRVSLTNLASYLGISRETLSRIRKG